MKKICIVLSIVLSMIVVAEDDVPPSEDGSETNAPPKIVARTTRIKCAICGGKGKLKVRPIDVGQYQGKIEAHSHWDIQLDKCPICDGGHGRRTVWDISQPEPRVEPPCTSCGWSGLTQCRRCLASGITKCRHTDCKEGWIVIKPARSGHKRKSCNVQPTDVRQCPDCKGIGKIVCPECKGMRATICRRCHGIGRKMR